MLLHQSVSVEKGEQSFESGEQPMTRTTAGHKTDRHGEFFGRPLIMYHGVGRTGIFG